MVPLRPPSPAIYNPLGPEIVLNGSRLGNASGLYISGDNNIVAGLVINGFTDGAGVGAGSGN